MFRVMMSQVVAGLFLFLAQPALAEKPMVPETIQGTTRVSAEEMIDLAANKPELVIIDARKAADFQKGFIEGAVSLPDTDTTQESLATHIKTKSTPVVFYCNGVRCGRSVKSSEMAVSLGYENIYWFRGGWEEWTEKGYPVSH